MFRCMLTHPSVGGGMAFSLKLGSFILSQFVRIFVRFFILYLIGFVATLVTTFVTSGHFQRILSWFGILLMIIATNIFCIFISVFWIFRIYGRKEFIWKNSSIILSTESEPELEVDWLRLERRVMLVRWKKRESRIWKENWRRNRNRDRMIISIWSPF